MNNLTAVQMVKSCGLPGIKYVSEKSGVGVMALLNWFHSQPKLFRVVLAGCAAIHELEKNEGVTLAELEDHGDGASIHG